ncbi:hypothetical protein PVAP13_9NG820800 [Panicum virgatum]|uniref:Bifunctional inhibitor/plant lipid transfer protein/seed storage helical domain-containing protein n=1 Tax=Panicum virgatum TaxID=38727 RepID=A0A8T0N1S1_PANVG|nr:hypothetical protein PVAP13_9NG820800 [Panicum virgatum]
MPAGPRARGAFSSRRRARLRRHGRAGAGASAGGGLHGRAGEPRGVPELRAGGEHGGDARPDLLLGAPDVVRGEVACLCQVFQGGQNLGISLNMTKALQLPAACKVKTPPVSKCHVSVPGVPSASPVLAPSAGAPFFSQSPLSPAPSGSPVAAGTGIATSTPAPSPARSGAASLPASWQSFFTMAAAASALLVYCIF